MNLPKIKYITNPNKTEDENKQSEKTFRLSAKFVFLQCLLAPILGMALSKYSISYFLSGICLFIVVYLFSKFDKNRTNSTITEFLVYFLSGTSFALIIASIFAIIIQAITFII